jgi:HSF-type DNA-binding
MSYRESRCTMPIDSAGASDFEESVHDACEGAQRLNYQSTSCIQYRDRSRFRPGGTLPHENEPARFPTVLFRALSLIERDGLFNVICWQPHGRCFVIHKRKELEALLPRYFKSITKYKSLQRQLYNYGFRRLKSTKDKGGYYHEFFLRDRPDLLCYIDRTGEAGSGVRARRIEPEPNFYRLPFVTPYQSASVPGAVGLNSESRASLVMATSLSKTNGDVGLSQESEIFVSNVRQELSSWIEGDDETSCPVFKSFLNSLGLSKSIAEGRECAGQDSTCEDFPSDQALLVALEERCGYGSPVLADLEPIPLFPFLPHPMYQVGQH